MERITGKFSSSRFGWLILLLLLLGINFVASVFHSRIDLTKEKRYTLSKATNTLVGSLNDKVEIDVFLKGEFPSGFRRLANSTDEFLQLLKDRNGSRIQYRFISPEDKVPGASISYGDSLQGLGALPINLTVQLKAGQSSNIIFPVAVIHYKGKQALVNLYPGASRNISQTEINSAEALMEYQFVNALNKLVNEKRPAIGYAVGNGEPTDGRTYDLVQTLEKENDFRIFNLATQKIIPDNMDVLMIVKPTQQFSEQDKLKIDQYVMRGGKLLCFIDNLVAEQDSLSGKPETIAFDRNLNLTDLFFRYGLRINTDLIMDLQSDMIPFVVGGTMDNPQFEFLHWNYFPLLNAGSNKLNNLGYIAGRFVNSIDTIKVAGVVKTPLLVSSSNSRIISTPARISLNENRNAPQDASFTRQAIPAAMLLEGKFTSLYKNRASQADKDSLAAAGVSFASESRENKIIVVADGDAVLNEFIADPETKRPTPLPMGWNKYTFGEYQKQSEGGKFFIPVANHDFLLASLDYLVNNAAITATRNKDIVLRLLDTEKVKENKTMWQLINIVLPILLIILAGVVYQVLRKRKYSGN